ncbi:S24 family peptidase [Ligilactobacillus ubinensis]
MRHTLKLIRHIGNSILLMSDNPDYDPIVIYSSNPIRVLGKAVKMTTDF